MPTAKKDLIITVINIKGAGRIDLGLYKRGDKFLAPDSGKGYTVDPKGQSSITFTISDVEYGEYAVALFHDKDGDGKLKTKIFGIPAEPIGFSNNVRPIFSAPKFDKCKFMYDEKNNSITIKLFSM